MNAHIHRRRSVTAFVAVMATAAAGLVIGAGPSVAAVPSPPKDVITIDTTGTTGAIRYWDSTGTQQPAQTLATSSKGCAISTNSTYLGFDGTVGSKAGTVGYNTGSIGVTDKSGSLGQACGQIDASAAEALTITLKSGRLATSALLDVEVKQDALVLATTSRGGVVTGTYELQTGSSVSADGSSKVPASKRASNHSIWACNLAADSGSDSKANDNCGWLIDGVFDTIKLEALVGSVSLEGGSDGNIPGSRTGTGVTENVSYFTIGVPCSAGNSTVNFSDGAGPLDDASYTRHTANADGSPCLAVATSLTRQADGDLELVKPAGQPFTQGVVTSLWSDAPGAPADQSSEVNFLPPASADFESGWVTMPWCPSSLLNADGSWKPLANISSNPDTAAGQLTALGLVDQDFSVYDSADPTADNDLFQYACVLERGATKYNGATGKFESYNKYFLLGDVIMRK